MHAPAGTACLIPLDDEVPVVLLNRKMDRPKPIDRTRAIERRSAPNTRQIEATEAPALLES